MVDDNDPQLANLDARAFRTSGVYLNAAAIHPLPEQGRRALQDYAEQRGVPVPGGARGPNAGSELRILFAALINADPGDIALAPSTMFAENLIALGLGLGDGHGRVVTDELHFEPSLYLYTELARRGAQLTIVPQRGGRIELADYEAALRAGARLVAVSAVSAVNGFQHDLKALCDLAHRHGALVFADVIQAAGAIPFDVVAAGIDACACSTYKWLMGDFGIGFLFTTAEARRRLRRVMHGHDQLDRFSTNILPFDPSQRAGLSYAVSDGSSGLFGVGVRAAGAIAASTASLRALTALGVPAVQARHRPIVARLREGMADLGYRALSPEDGEAPILAYALKGPAAEIAPRLAQAGVTVSLHERRLRISPSVYNTVADAERLLDALK